MKIKEIILGTHYSNYATGHSLGGLTINVMITHGFSNTAIDIQEQNPSVFCLSYRRIYSQFEEAGIIFLISKF